MSNKFFYRRAGQAADDRMANAHCMLAT